MKKRKLFLLPLFCLLLAGCGGTSQSGDNNKGNEEQVTPTPGPDQGGEETPSDGGGETPAPVVNNAALNITEKALIEDETFELSVSNIPEGMTPSWSKYGDAISYVLNEAKTSATVKAEEAGQGTILVVVGEKVLSCTVNVTAKRVALPSPVLALNTAKNGLTWAVITGAEGYIIKVNDAEPVTVTDPGYAFSQTAGTYAVQVTAKADLAEFNSVPATFNYETKIAAVGQLQFVNNNAVTCASAVGMGVEAKLGDGEYAAVTNNSLAVTQDGTYTFHAKGGFDEENNFFYVEGNNAVATIDVVIRQKLATPVLGLNTNQNGCTWAAVADAEGYSIKVNEEPAQTVTEPGYLFATVAGQYHVVIKALADLPEFDSEEAEFDYEVKYTALGDLTFEGNKITWDSFVGAKLQYKLGDGQFADVSGDELVINKEGTYTLKAIAGIGANNVYYVDSNTVEHEKSVVATAPTEYIAEAGLDDNNTDLMDRYVAEKWDDNKKAWVSTQAKLFLESTINEGYTEGRAVRVHYWANYSNFRFSQEAQFIKGYDTMSFDLKGNGYCDYFIVRLIINKAVQIGSVNLTGVYASYKVTNPSEDWSHYVLNLDDDNFQITFGGNPYTPTQIKSALAAQGMTISSVSELIPYFDTIAYVVKGGTSNGAEKDVYFDTLKFTNEHGTSGVTPIAKPVELKQKYAMNTAAVHGEIEVVDNEHANATILQGGVAVTLPVTLAINEDEMTVTSTNTSADFVLVVNTTDGGSTWNYVSCTGTLAAAMTNARFGEMKVVEDFSSYSATGIGYDKSHGQDQVSGMRANFYCDFYDEYNGGSGTQSPLGGTNWWLMGSSDYMDYDAAGCFNAGAARLKSIDSYRNMRYLSAGLATGTTTAIGKGYATMSVMIKGNSNRDVKVKIGAFYSGTALTPSTQTSNRTFSSDWLTVAKDSGWTEYKLTLDASKTYYGYMILVSAGSNTAYIYVDNVIFYK